MLRVITEPAAQTAGDNDLAGDLEYVLGRRQIASLSFVVVVALAVASGASYLAGKAVAARAAQPGKPSAGLALASTTPAVAAAPAPETTKVETTKAETTPAPAAAPPSPAKSDAGVNALLASEAALPSDESVFGEPVPGSLYVQVGAMDRGPAMILTSGLRKRGFPSVTARGPSDTIFRVLVGPYKTLPEYQNAKEAIRQMGITGFGRYGE